MLHLTKNKNQSSKAIGCQWVCVCVCVRVCGLWILYYNKHRLKETRLKDSGAGRNEEDFLCVWFLTGGIINSYK